MKQSQALDMLKLGKNIFLTGPAGCGKTFLLNSYIDYLKKNRIKTGVTASTGIAATHLNGRTIHSWCGMGINESMSGEQIKLLLKKETLADRIKSTKVLIIDEVSMINAKRLDLVNYICQAFRGDERSFGGMQVVLCGDFFQLPPVASGDEDNRFVTESEIWKSMNIKICYLKSQYRQADKDFLKVLNDIRNNTVDNDTVKILKERLNKSIKSKIKPTKLYTHNNSVDIDNITELNKLSGKEISHEMEVGGNQYVVEGLKKSCLAPEILKLKIGAVVMFVRNNYSKKYVNGTLGKVIAFDEDDNYPVVETVVGDVIVASPENWLVEDGNDIQAFVSQVPLRLAWAITVHKSQGMSLDCAVIDLSKTFEYGMGYVALSRVRSLSGIKLIGINKMALQVNSEALKLDKMLQMQSKQDLNEMAKLGKKEIEKIQKDFLAKNKDDNSYGNFF